MTHNPAKLMQSGRILLALTFLITGLGKLFSFNATAEFMATAGTPAAGILLTAAILAELAGGLALLSGKHVMIGAKILLVFVVLATLMVHLDMSDPNNMPHLAKNIGLAGALLMVMAHAKK